MTDTARSPSTLVYTALVARLQDANHGRPVVLSPSEVARNTGISEIDQIHIRQSLMRAGRLRLSVVDGRWAYAVGE